MFRVMTLNIWNLSGPWRDRREEIALWIERLMPDVVCLQEVVQGPSGHEREGGPSGHEREGGPSGQEREGGPTRDQASWLASCARLAPHDYEVALAPGLELPDGARFGNAILSRRPIDVTNVVPLTPLHRESEGRVLLHARTGDVDVFSTHLNWKFHHGDVRQGQVIEIARAIDDLKQSGPLPAILAGDFNAEPDSDEIRFLTGDTALEGRTVYYQDAWRVAGGRGQGATWDNRNPFAAKEHEPDRRIDYIFVGWKRENGAGRVEAARVVCDRALTGTYATDHYGLVADLAT